MSRSFKDTAIKSNDVFFFNANEKKLQKFLCASHFVIWYIYFKRKLSQIPTSAKHVRLLRTVELRCFSRSDQSIGLVPS
jgi:hypothetical protein